MSRINHIIDFMDALERVPDGEAAWLATRDFAEGLGAAYVALGVVDCRMARPEWAMMSFGPRLMADYLAADMHLSDPSVSLCAQGAAGWNWTTRTPETSLDGQVRPVDPHEADALRLMSEHGIGRSVGLPGQLVGGRYRDLFCYGEFDGDRAVEAHGGAALMRLVGALALTRVSPPPPGHPDAPGYDQDPLSPREKDVLRLLAAGRMNARIAEDLGVAEVTVRMHLRSARAKLGAATREQALAIALTRGLLDL